MTSLYFISNDWTVYKWQDDSGTAPYPYPTTALLRQPQGLDKWHDPRFEASRQDVIDDKYGDSTYSGLKDQK